MDIGVEQFGMNFTAIRLNADKLSIYGESQSGGDEIDEIQVVVFRPGDDGDGDALFARMVQPELEWSATVTQPSPYVLGDEVYVVGVAIRRGHEDPHVWRNLLEVISDTEGAPGTAPVAADAD